MNQISCGRPHRACGRGQDVAARFELARISDLARHPAIRLGFTNEFLDRPDGWAGLAARYELPHRDVRGLEHAVAYRALAGGDVDAIALFREGERAEVYRAWDENEESAFVAQKIRGLRGEGREYRDVAVFYRTNAQSRVLEDALRRAGIPYLIVGGVRFYERREIRDMVAYLRLISNPLERARFQRHAAVGEDVSRVAVLHQTMWVPGVECRNSSSRCRCRGRY